MSDPVRITNPGAESLGYDWGARRIRKKSYAKVFRASVRAETALLQIVGGDKLIIPFC